MIRSAALSLIFLLCSAAVVLADEAQTLEEAEKLSSQTGKPILMKFFKEG